MTAINSAIYPLFGVIEHKDDDGGGRDAYEVFVATGPDGSAGTLFVSVDPNAASNAIDVLRLLETEIRRRERCGSV